MADRSSALLTDIIISIVNIGVITCTAGGIACFISTDDIVCADVTAALLLLGVMRPSLFG